MHIQTMECIQEILVSAVESQMECLDKVNTKELGEAIDMLKDLSEAIYYSILTKVMEENATESKVVENIDEKFGKSYAYRKRYIESKETKTDKVTQMKDLEKYSYELAQDIIEMIQDSTPEEKQYLSKKITALSNKIIQPSETH